MVFAVLLSIIPNIAYAEDLNSKTYTQDGYTIDYAVVNSWGNSQNVTVTIKNTGTEAIDNWMLEYDFNGNVVGIWNAVIEADNSGSEYIKNAGYNAVIEPEGSVVFGYTLENSTGFPNSIVMCQEEAVKESGYDVFLNVINEWDNNFNGEIIITNTADKAIECWTLDFDSNFTIVEITDSWAAAILSANEGKYTLKGTYTNIIYGNSSVTIGFTGKKSGVPEITDFSLTEIIKSNSVTGTEKPDLADIGQMYFKDIQSEDEIEYDGNGIYYVRSQMLLTANDGVSFNEVEALAQSLNAEIVGYIELTNDYQLEFNTEMTADELYLLIDELKMNQLIDYSSLNTVIEVGDDYIPQDYDWWDGKSPKNVDWGIKAVKADEAWNYFDESKEENGGRNIVKIGLIDNYFEKHNDLDYKYIWNNPDSAPLKNPGHGTHVAGIMAATFDNKTNSTVSSNIKNVAGICPKNELYAYASGKTSSSMEYKYALALLIANNVRVINISQNSGHEQCYGASNGNEAVVNYIKTNAKIIEKFLKKLIDKNYDFLIVTSAGNVNGVKFVKMEKTKYGYKINSKGEFSTNAEAIYNSFLNYVKSADVKKRIICVGSISLNGDPADGKYIYSDFSNIGNRVDVVAPGENIYSTVLNNDYDKKNGTSMAAPHASGIAGMMYSIDPSLTAEMVKQIIKETATRKISTLDNSYTYGLVDAKAAVDKVLGNDGEYEEKTNGIVLGKVIENDSAKGLEDVTITVYEILDSEIKKSEEIKVETTNQEGEYEVILPIGDYLLEFTKDGYVAHREKVTVIDSLVKKIDDIQLVEGISLPVKDEKSKIFISNVNIDVKSVTYKDITNYITNESGEFTFVCSDDEYEITLTQDGYDKKVLCVTAKDGLLYDQSGTLIEEILLNPIQAIISGKVEKYDRDKNIIEPYDNLKLVIYKRLQSDTDKKILVAEVVTDLNGEYKAVLDLAGDYIVIFTEEKQHEVSVTSSGNFIINEIIEIDKDKDDNNDNGSSDTSDSSWDDDVSGDININFDGSDDSYTGDHTGSLSEGIWLSTSNGKDDYYVRIYTTPDAGEYKSTFGTYGWGLYTTLYNNWIHELKIVTYRMDGTLINERTLDYFYKETYIYLPNGYGDSSETTPLMQINSITSAAINSKGITYNMHTDGYYKGTTNFIGSLGIKKEDWTKDETKTITFYNNSTVTGASNKSPF